MIEVADVAAMEHLGAAIGARLVPGDVLCLTGPLGAGKTALTRGIAAGLGVPAGAVASPTFVIARRHRGTRADLVHCDAYRLGDDDDFRDIVPDPELVVTVVEWGARAVELLADSWLEIVIDRGRGDSDDTRRVRFVPHGADWENRDVRSWTEPAL